MLYPVEEIILTTLKFSLGRQIRHYGEMLAAGHPCCSPG